MSKILVKLLNIYNFKKKFTLIVLNFNKIDLILCFIYILLNFLFIFIIFL